MTNSQNDSTELREQIERVCEIHDVVVKDDASQFVDDLMNLITHYGIEQRIDEGKIYKHFFQGTQYDSDYIYFMSERIAELEKKKEDNPE